MKRSLILLLCSTLVVMSAMAYDLMTSDGLCYNLSGTEASVVAGEYGSLTEAIIPENVTDENGTSYTVTTIATSVFSGCTTLQHASIPETVTKIGANAFYGCSLTSLSIYADITNGQGFNACSVRELYVADNVTTLKGLGIAPSVIYCFGDVPPVCDEGTFSSYTAALHVTARGFGNYFTADVWNQFNNIFDNAGQQPNAIELNSTEVSVDLGETVQLSAQIFPVNNLMNVHWSTNDDVVATVSDRGLVFACSVGQATIYATCMGIRKACHVTVAEQAVIITIDHHDITLRRNSTITLTATSEPIATNIEWSTTDASVAAVRVVNGNAMVVGLLPGEAMIIANSAIAGAHPDSCLVTVIRPRGDATKDGYTDVDDLNAMINVILDLAAPPETDDFPFYDLTGDGNIDVEDINKIINIILGLSDDSNEIKTYTVNGVSFKMVKVEGGTFTMGATAEQDNDAENREKPTHQVTLSCYSIGETEVTQELWKAVMESNPSYFNGNYNSTYGSHDDYGTNLQRPVECVTWDDCQEFFAKLNQLTGKNFRLPTEAEWEYAARGGKLSKGYKYAGSNDIGDVAWYISNSSYTTHPVGTKSPNELGLYDMSGNVWEWCQDWYGDYSSGAQTNPTGSTSGSYRVSRGGGWDFSARGCRVSGRKYDAPSYASYHLGLRLTL